MASRAILICLMSSLGLREFQSEERDDRLAQSTSRSRHSSFGPAVKNAQMPGICMCIGWLIREAVPVAIVPIVPIAVATIAITAVIAAEAATEPSVAEPSTGPPVAEATTEASAPETT